MKVVAFTAITLVFIGLGVLLVSPMVQFIYEFTRNPALLSTSISPSYYNTTHVQLTFKLSYGGSVELSNVDAEVTIGGVRASNYASKMLKGDALNVTMIVPAEVALEAKLRAHFIIGDVYPLIFEVGR
ncbi:MAG: hypothetical protein QXK12_02070 [Candidatus Nezhaarchaeales archaeon]